MGNDGRGLCSVCGRTDHALREIADLRAKLEQAKTVQYITPEACEHLCPVSARARRLEEALKDIMAWGVEFDDERIKYVVVQVDRASIAEALAALAPEKPPA